MVLNMPKETLKVLAQVHLRLTHEHGLSVREANCMLAGAVSMWHWMHSDLDPQSANALVQQMARELMSALDSWIPPISDAAN